MHLTTAEWGGLTCHIAHAAPADVPPRVAVVLCHGFGAPGTDLVGLAEPLLRIDATIGERVAFVFTEAQLSLEDQGLDEGRAWWWIDLDRLLRNSSPATLEQFRTTCPPGLDKARLMLTQVVERIGLEWRLPPERIVLGGFSQGSMLATDVALRLPTAPALLCILSGATICEPEWKSLAAERGPMRVLQSHGRFDDVLLFSEGERLRDLLQSGGAEVEFLELPGYHEIGTPVLLRLAQRLRELAMDG